MTRKTFTVVWDEILEENIAAFWATLPIGLRGEFTRACNEVDRTLASAPESVGRPWPHAPNGLIWSVPDYSFSIVIVYEVHHDDRIVKLSRIHLAR